MSAPPAANPFLHSDAAAALLTDLRRATDGRTGDRLSTVIRAVTTAGSTLPPAEVDAAIAAIALLLAERDPSMLDGADDEPALREWLRHVDTDLTPGRQTRRVRRPGPHRVGSGQRLAGRRAGGWHAAMRRCSHCADCGTVWPTPALCDRRSRPIPPHVGADSVSARSAHSSGSIRSPVVETWHSHG